jgi:hypothetical protein
MGLELEAELAQAHAMLDVLATRLSAIPEGDRGNLANELASLRGRWGEARDQAENAKESGGDLRRQYEAASRAALGEVQDGLAQMIAGMNQRFAGHPPTR